MKNKYLFLSLILVAGLSACNSSFNPFDFDSLDIISNEQAIYISNEATDNLSNVTSLTHSVTSSEDYRTVFIGSAYFYGYYSDETYTEDIDVYSNNGLSISITTVSESGNNYAGSSYSEISESIDLWIEYDTQEEQNYAYFVSEYSNPNSKEESILSSYRYVFSSETETGTDWNQLIVNLVSDDYTFSSFDHYGSSSDNIYAYSENITQSTVANPLHPSESIITYSESMSVRSFVRDASLGWVIDYSAHQENLYYSTTIDGNVYESPVLVEAYQEVYQYSYESNGSKSFEFIDSAETYYYQPNIISAAIDSQGELTFSLVPLLGNGYLVNYSNPSLSYYSATLELEADKLYACYMEIDDEIILYGSEAISKDELSLLEAVEIEIDEETSYSFISVSYDVRVNAIFGFDSEGNIVSLDIYYLNRVGGWQ
ncbi:MAG: hypothetical protein LUC16_01855 [Coprobacillus sp.]|nr:hypothetical protein [Coprobacillus sp.]